MIIVIAGMFENGDKGTFSLQASHGLNPDTLQSFPLPNEHPAALGAVFDSQIGEWVIE